MRGPRPSPQSKQTSAAPVPAAPPVKPPTAESRPVPPPETNAAALAAQQGILHPTNPPKQTIVLEAEMFSDLNYGWEIKADPTTSEGAYITIKKGIANNTALLRGCGDFYNIGDNRDISRLFYTFRVPSSGMWFVQGRVKTTGTHCSNILATFMDETKFGAFGPRVVPFSWAWDAPKQVYLKAGVHHLRVYPWECGVSLDQIIITKTAVEGNAIFYANASNETHGSNTFFLVHDLDTCVLDESRPPRLNVWLRRTQDLGEGVKLKTVIGLPGGEKELPVPEFILSDAKRLVCLPIDLSGVDIKKLPCREYLLKSIVTVNGEIQCSATTALVKPFHWRVLGMLPFVMIETPLPPDGWAEEKEYSIHGKRYSWKPFENKWYDPFGVMDFGLTFANNSEYAPEHRTVYAQTMFKVLREDEYLLKSLCDDQMTLWVDGNVVRESDEFNCAIRKAGRTRVHLAAGEHKMQYRLNQSRDRWQAGVFIRTTNDLVTADIEGME